MEPDTRGIQPRESHQIQPGSPVKSFIIGGDEAKNKFENTKQEVITSTIKRMKCENALKDIIGQLTIVSPILVTGSSGYLGSAIVQTLREHGIKTIGIDLVDAPSTDFIGCVSDINILRTSASQGCKSVIHTAALHAPNLDYYSEKQFQMVNVDGTQNILMVAKEFQMKAVVFSSTTSLMITKEVKIREQQKNNGTVILKDSVDYGEPRNSYGVTKKIAEKLCIENEHLNIAILRCSRFFVEDMFDTGIDPSSRNIQKTNGNTKANEMLCGTRASLEDTVLSHLIAIDRLSKNNTICPGNEKLGPLIISSISPLLSNSFDISIASKSQLYKDLDWSPPDCVSRIYDSTNSWKILNCTPKWDFMRLIREYEEEKKVMDIQNGHY